MTGTPTIANSPSQPQEAKAQESFQMTPSKKGEEEEEDSQAVSSETRLLVANGQLDNEAKLKAVNETEIHVGGGDDGGGLNEAVISTSLLPQKNLHSTSLTSLASITVELCGRNTKLTRNQIIVLCLLSIYFFTVSCYFSLVAPFFPGQAKDRGLNQTQIGVIFSIYQAFLFIGAPLFGKYVIHIFKYNNPSQKRPIF